MAHTENAIVIGIDFGTTFSGVSWAFSGQPNEIEQITAWETELNYTSDTKKVPTAIIYRGAQGAVSWGYDIPMADMAGAMRWFKLLLVDEADLPDNLRTSSQIATARKAVRKANKDPVEVITSYIRCLWNHSIECIRTSAGDELIKLCTFHVVITLPAIWPDYAKARMRRAAENAGLLEERPAGQTTLAFISEPEAAALATMKDFANRPDIKAGDYFVVCDAGGGTVDLISYEMLSMDPMVVREAIKGDGDLCGGVFLDEAFIDLIKNKVTSEAWDKAPKDEVADVLNCNWEQGIKKQFDGQVRSWHVNLPPGYRSKKIPGQGTKRKRQLMFDLEDLLPVFNPIANKIGSLVQKQIDGVRAKSGKLPKNLILVGGFGRCRYLRSHLQSVIDKDIAILQSPGSKPWTAICRGAVIHGLTQKNMSPGLSVNVQSRIARASYGVTFETDFKKREHSARSKIWSDKEQKWMASDQMSWFLKQGTDISNTTPVRENFYRLYDSAPSEVSDSLYVSSDWPPPSEKDSSVKELCEITWNKKIDFESLPRHVNSLGKVFHRIDYTIEMVCAGASIDFAVSHDGKRVGAKNVSVVFDKDASDVKFKRSPS
ncbi:actin-like ATPase domain-containing protein [Colletotrichum falcatum]|nr:actin-like ATPase domain-containing protein [Colletotrichum falcatum]